MFLKIFFVICIQINFVYNCDDSVSDVTDTSGISEEYLNIFRTIPTLFEYVMDVIEEKPEILEKDDISVFTMETSKYYDEISNPDDSNLFENEHDGGSKQGTEGDESESADESYFGSSEEDADDTSSIEDIYVDSESSEYLDISRDEEYDDDEDENDESADFWSLFASAVASKRTSLTSTEIAEKTLEIEKQLEEYNNNNKS